ncbi:hypothetical protein N7532_005984 [Penicillium argentinense]|uniref:Uncharacterized protein n=1 Tax=Penicillium argentinense TaxID=1131581 RepID=A0A9W9KAG7_9EURO|nr:uncharacterized protein N7532_005984 [Penicillium argentinense]KAJ5098983.1 hypothetical protein N7532_005984 [Penicillium argentinense]
MTSTSRGAVTLPIWSEGTTARPHVLHKHLTVDQDRIVTVYKHQRRNSPTKDMHLSEQDIGPASRAKRAGNFRVQSPNAADIQPGNAAPDQPRFEDRFWTEKASAVPEDSPFTNPKVVKSTNNWNIGKGSIAAVVIISVITVLGLSFLVYWYINRECKERRRRRMQISENLFDQSTLTLGEETSKTLDEFLMRDVEPERTSVMFSRSRSPSIAIVVDESERRRSRASRHSYDASVRSLMNLDPLDPLARMSTDEARPSFIISELTDSSSGPTQTTPSFSNRMKTTSSSSKSQSVKSQPAPVASPRLSPHASPRASQSISSVLPSTMRSSQLWETTTAAATSATASEKQSLFWEGQKSSRTSLSLDGGSQSASHNLSSEANSLFSSRSPHTSNASRASRNSSRWSGQSPIRSLPWMINDAGLSRRNHERTYSSQSRSINMSSIAESMCMNDHGHDHDHDQTPSVLPSPSPVFHISDAS